MATNWRMATTLKDMPIWRIVLGVLGCFVFLGIVWVNVWSVCHGKKVRELLGTEGEATIGTIIKITSGRRSKMWAKFHFDAEGKRYDAEEGFYMSMDVREGDRFEVVYWPKDPTVCRLDFKKPVYDAVVREKFKLEALDSLAMDSILHQWP